MMIGFTALKTTHHWEDEESLRLTLERLQPTDSLLLYQNHVMDSSLCGRQHRVICGPGRSIPSASEAPSWIDPDQCGGLPSRREQFVGEVDVADLKRGLGY